MNWLLIIVLAIILFCAVHGWMRGLLRILYSLVSIILMVGLIAYATPHISSFVKENTGVYTSIQEKCTDAIREKAETGIENSVKPENATGNSFPDKISSYIMSAGENALEESGVYEAMGSKTADWILGGIAFFLALILALIVVNLIGKALDIVNKIPIIKGINRTLGIFAGLFQGFLIVWLLFLFLALIAGTSLGEVGIQYINENLFLKYLYYNNALLEVFSYFFK